MAEYLANAVQEVALNTPVLFNASSPCTRGYVYHEDGSGLFTLCGKTPNCFARYRISFTGNIAIPTGGTVGPIALAITENGEIRPASRSIFTPAAVDSYGNVTCIASIDVPRGCCFSVSIRCVSASNDPTVVPAPVINVQNANLTIDRKA